MKRLGRAVGRRFEQCLFDHRRAVIAVFVLLVLVMAASASRLRVDADFEKMVPAAHPYMQVFSEYREDFGGADRVLVALTVSEGEIFTAGFMEALRAATDEVFFIPGVDRARVTSLFTPNVRFVEVVEDGLSGGDVVPADFAPTPAGLARVRENVLRSDVVGRLVADDLGGALISAELLAVDAATGEPVDYVRVSRDLEERVRMRFDGLDDGGRTIEVHIVGFARVVGEVADALERVALFFLLTLVLTGALVTAYTRSLRLAAPPVACSLIAVLIGLGLLPLLGLGIDPLSILVPFLVFAIGVSHGVQMVGAFRAEALAGADPETAARRAFRRLLLPGAVALASDSLGFLAITVIDIGIVREMAVTAGVGVAAIVLTNLLLLPLWLAGLRAQTTFPPPPGWRWFWPAAVARPRVALAVLGCAAVLAVFGAGQASTVSVGDRHAGVPELREDSRYNRDARVIVERFRIGVDSLSVFVVSEPEGCIDFDVMRSVDTLAWRLANVEDVQFVQALPFSARAVHSGWNEGGLKWRELPRDPLLLAQAVAPVPTASGLLNPDCSVMPVYAYTVDHRAETIDAVIAAAEAFAGSQAAAPVQVRLAGGNLGVMAATNQVVADAQFPILLGVFVAVVLLCWFAFGGFRAALVIVVPLALVSLLAYSAMSLLGIGLKPTTLPVVAFGAGIGVDYGIYLYHRLRLLRASGCGLEEAWRRTLEQVGSGVVVTASTLSVGVATWLLSPLRFQADMGLLLVFLFVANMIAAVLVLPALVRWLWPRAAV